MKKWLLEGFLPMWAKQTVLRDNRALSGQVKTLQQENQRLLAYIRGLEKGMRACRRSSGTKGGDA